MRLEGQLQIGEILHLTDKDAWMGQIYPQKVSANLTLKKGKETYNSPKY